MTFTHSLNGLDSYFKDLGVRIDSYTISALETYARELLHWNKTQNLSGASTFDSVAQNIIDSLYPLRFIDEFKSCLDVGSGGGFPAIALGIVKKDSQFFLSEPRVKRFSFLQNIIATLNLQNIQVLDVRLQDIPITQVNNIDLITSRASISVEEIMHYGYKFLSFNGHYLLYKGSQFKKEVEHLGVEECFIRDERIYFYKKG